MRNLFYGEVGAAAVFLTLVLGACSSPSIDDTLQLWHPVTITFEGPESGELGRPNPFLDYRLDVVFTHSQGDEVEVPGYYAGDGNAAETGAASGNRWRVHFLPDKVGQWTYDVSFRSGTDIVYDSDPEAGRGIAFDGRSGSFVIAPSDKVGRDFRGKGRLDYVGERYLKFAGNGDYYLKGGADSPENFLAYVEFDGTLNADTVISQREGEAAPSALHEYLPHVSDWNAGDPVWKDNKGKGIIGALNYLAGKGMNSVYFLTMNVAGDGDDVFPWLDKRTYDRFDVSKLDQWEIVFSHMDSLGIVLHVLTQETENDQLLDGGEMGRHRMVYYRELAARFAHHPALIWNLGEENTNTDAQRKAFAGYIRDLDPYDHPIVVHTYPGQYDDVYTPLLGFENFEGPSLQMGDMTQTHAETIKWINRSHSAGRPWFVSLDEIGPANTGVMPDGEGSNQDLVRHHALWGNLMAGGAGVEWYFGYRFPHNDLNLEDWRSRDRMWEVTRHALDFFHENLPFNRMVSADTLTERTDDFVFVEEGSVYAVYLPQVTGVSMSLPSEVMFSVRWFDPEQGTFVGEVTEVTGGPEVIIEPPAGSVLSDGVILIERL